MKMTLLARIARPLPLLIAVLVCTPLLSAPDLGQVAKNAEEMAAQAASNIEPGKLFAWLVTGLLIGSLVGTLATRREVGFGFAGNLGLGLVGALLGGLICDKLGVRFGLGELVISYDNLLAAALGALIVVIVLFFVKTRYLRARTPAKKSKD